MRSRSERKNKAVIRSLLAKFMVLLMIVNIFNVINPAIVRADDTKHFENNAIMVPEGGITAKNYNNGKFDVEMLVKGDGSTITEEKKLDVVLVVDRSYDNMSRNRKMAAAKDEAAKLVDYFLKSGNNKVRVGLVSFAGNNGGSPSPVLGVTQLTQDANVLKNAIGGYNAVGWNKSPVLREAFTQAGLIKANEMFGASNTNKKTIVLISGGVPTISYGQSAPDFTQREEAHSDIPKEGYEIWSENSWLAPGYRWKKGFDNSNSWTPYYVKHVKKLIDVPMGKADEVKANTIAEANDIKTKNNVEIFSIGVNVDDTAREVLRKIASDNRYYENNISENVVDEVVKNLKETKKVNSIENGTLEVRASEQVNSELNNIELTVENKDTAATPEEKADLDKRLSEITKNFNNGTLTLNNITLGKNEVLSIKYKAELQEAYKNGSSYKILKSATLYPKGKNGQKVDFTIPTVKDGVYSSVKITKVWKGTPEGTAKFGLFKKVAPNDKLEKVANANPKVVKNNNSWEIEFEGVKNVDEHGKAIEYVVKELDGQENPLKSGDIVTLNDRKYIVSESDNGNTITNTELIDITVEKKWADGVPETATKSIKFRITKDSKSTEFNKTYELNKENGWTKKFENLPLYKGNDKIEYSVIETHINGEEITTPINPVADAEGNHVYNYKAFKITLSKNALNITDSGKVTITNSVKEPESNTPNHRIIKVVKNWGNTPVSNRKEVEVTLYKLDKNGEMVKADGIDPITLNNNSDTDKDWQGEFVAPLKDENGEFVQYYAFETRIDNATAGAIKFEPNLYNDGYKIGEYSVRISELTSGDPNAETGDYGFYILNESEDATDDPVIPEEKISINVTKTWTDSTPAEYKLPVKVRLFIENGEYLVPVTAVSEILLDESNSWTGKFENLEKIIGDDGKEIKYYVYEVGVGTNNTIDAVGFISRPDTYKIGSYNVTIVKNGTTDVTITNDRKPDQTSGGGEVVPREPFNPGTDNNTNNQQAPDANTPDVNVTDDKTPQGTVNTDKTLPDEDTDETGIADIDEDETPQGSIDSGKDTASDKKTKVEDKVNEDDTPQGKTALPKTGGTNATIFGVIGLGLIGLALLIKRRR